MRTNPSREAQLVALTHFQFGRGCEVTFGRAKYDSLPDQHLRGLAELHAAGMVTREIGKTLVVFRATEEMGKPWQDFEKMKPSESWEF